MAVSLSAGTALALPQGTTVDVPAGTLVGHPDGTTSNLPGAITVILPGGQSTTSVEGTQWSVAGTDVIIPDGTLVTVTLPSTPAYAVISADGSPVALPNSTSVNLYAGQPLPFFYENIFDDSHYNPDWDWVEQPAPVKNLDFTLGGAYSIYNWELFFHAPLLIAVHLSQNQKYKDAQKWFHYIFNPTDNSPGPTPQRFWKVQPFQSNDVQMIEQVLVNLSTGQNSQLRQQTINSISDWRDHPFEPWEVAKFRPTAYMLKTVTAYLDNLVAWGDSLFQQYTIETINEATQIYILAANILGPKPQAVMNKGSVKALTFNDLRANTLDDFGNAMVDMEVDIPFDLLPAAGSGSDGNGSDILASIGKTLYFCIPRNDQLLGYWNTVADRLFKIHNSLNLQGVFQRLPLYDPPIDPALLVRAAAAGLDVSAIVSGLNQPLPLVRFQLLISKASEICQEVKSLGASLLQTIEKQDNESLSLLRAKHENTILGLMEMVKYSQWQEAQKATQGLELTIENLTQRYSYYQKLLGQSNPESNVPKVDPLDSGSLGNLGFSQSDATGEPKLALDPIDSNIAQNSVGVTDGEIKTLNKHEVEELDKLALARDLQLTESSIQALGSVLAIIPQFAANAEPMGCGASVHFGGQHLSSMCSGLAAISRAVAEEFSYEANRAAKLGSYSRRELEWIFQSNTAKAELNQAFKQLRGAQIREAIAKKEFENHQVQMQNAQQVVDFLEGNPVGTGIQTKETTTGFYAMTKREVKALHSKAFRLAFEAAKKAERALQNELGDPSLTFVQYNYLDGTEGLLAGEKLMLDIKAMEMAYHDLNQREYELTKHVSLLQVDPMALLRLRATGGCDFTLPEELFDLDGPGHYFRRTRSVAVTVPCVVGPYTSIGCTLTLQKSSIRISSDTSSGYPRTGSDDSRFNDYYGTAQTIHTSSSQADGGVFEPQDNQYLVPFEKTGPAGSQWSLNLPADVPQFDFDTITDVVLHIRYTAREGGASLKSAAVDNVLSLIKSAQTVGSITLLSVRHEFPSQWAKFKSAPPPAAELQLTLAKELYPFWFQGTVGVRKAKAIEFFAEMAQTSSKTVLNLNDKADQTGKADTLTQDPSLGSFLSGELVNIAKPSTVSDQTNPPLTIYFDDNSMKDLWVAVTW